WTVMLLVGLATIAALMRALSVLGQKHGKGLMLGSVTLMIVAAVLALTALRGWLAGASDEDVIQWTVTEDLVTGMLWLFWGTLTDRILSARGVAAAVAVWAVFASIYLAFLHASGMLEADAPARFTAFLLSSSLLPLAAFALAPWSFGL